MYTQLLIPLSSLLLLSSYLPTPSHALQDCLLLGSKFPAPQKPSRDPSITAAKFSLAQRLQKSLQNSSNSFSIDVFSTNEADSIFTYHQSAPSVLNSTAGVKKVDANTVYRVGSISKLFTVLVFLVGAGDGNYPTAFLSVLKLTISQLTGMILSRATFQNCLPQTRHRFRSHITPSARLVGVLSRLGLWRVIWRELAESVSA